MQLVVVISNEKGLKGSSKKYYWKGFLLFGLEKGSHCFLNNCPFVLEEMLLLLYIFGELLVEMKYFAGSKLLKIHN